MDLDRKQQLATRINSIGHRTGAGTLGALASFVVLLLAASSAGAATLNVSGGQLLGASGVIVDGNSYNVEFHSGTCIALYSGCDNVSDFTFQSQAAGLLASQALLDQVFLDGGSGAFDSEPSLTNGCSNRFSCKAFTPYAVDSFATVSVAAATNADSGGTDGTSLAARPASLGPTSFPSNVYAVWTPVPEPGTAVMMGLGLLGLSVRGRREG